MDARGDLRPPAQLRCGTIRHHCSSCDHGHCPAPPCTHSHPCLPCLPALPACVPLQALEYVASMQQDSHALHELVHKAGSRLRTRVTCAVLHAAGPGSLSPAHQPPPAGTTSGTESPSPPPTPTPTTAPTADTEAPQVQQDTQPPGVSTPAPVDVMEQAQARHPPASDTSLSWGAWLLLLVLRLVLGGVGFAAATFTIAMCMNDARGGGGRRGAVSSAALWVRVRLARLRLRLER